MLEQSLLALKHNLQQQITLLTDCCERLQTLCTMWAEYPHKWEAVLNSLCKRTVELRHLVSECSRLKQELADLLDIHCQDVPLSSLLCRVPQVERQILQGLQLQWQQGKATLETLLQRARKLLAYHNELSRQWEQICTLTSGTYDGRGKICGGRLTMAMNLCY